MEIIFQDNPVVVPGSVSTLADLASFLFPGKEKQVLAFLEDGIIRELNCPVSPQARYVPITFRDEVGRRIYERSLRFVMLLALGRLYPGHTVRIEHSISHGIFVRLPDMYLQQEDINRIETEMRSIIAEDLPFEKLVWSKKEIIDFFTRNGEEEKAKILSYQPDQLFYVYRCDSMTEYFYGEMTPSTSYVPVFALRLLYPGMVMMLPSSDAPDTPAVFIPRPKNVAAFEQSNQWCRIMHLVNASDVNEAISSGRFLELIRINEALHDKSIAQIAEGIHHKRSRAVFIAGPSSSGKTTFAHRLCIHLQVLGLEPVIISLDDYYRNKSDLPPEADGKPDLEALSALDLPYLKENIRQLLSGEPARIPRYDFTTGSRTDQTRTVTLQDNQLVLFEGIHALNTELHRDSDPQLTAKIYISELTCMNIDNHNRIRTTEARLLRRLVRDHLFRNTAFSETLDMWPSVRAGEEKWIFPFQENVDYVFNSVLHYELPVLKKYIYPSLLQVTPEEKDYLMARRLINLLQYFIDPGDDFLSEIPPLSILREFIGGNTFYR